MLQTNSVFSFHFDTDNEQLRLHNNNSYEILLAWLCSNNL